MPARIFSLSMALILLVLSACGLLPGQPAAPEANMANPAALHCEEQGGRLDNRLDAGGGQYGVCLFPDGTECEEWAFFRGECQPGDPNTAPGPAARPTYKNDAHRFSFNPPADWIIEEQAHLLKFRHQNYILWVQFQRSAKDVKPLAAPDPTLARLEAPPASLLGQELPKWLLVDHNKVKEVEYGPGITAGSLYLTIWLGYDRTLPIDPQEFEMPLEIIPQADDIIASFALTSGETPEITFGSP